MILMTSQDRTIMCVKGSRPIDPANGFDMFKHNTAMMLCIKRNADAAVKVDNYSRGSKIDRFNIPYRDTSYQIPHQLDVASKGFNMNMFDADLPQKNQKRNYQ